MGSFPASLRAIGDVSALPATVEVEDGRLSIAAGSTEIGTWSLTEIHLEPIPTGYRMAADGDQILIELKDIDSFTAAITTKSRKRRKKTAVSTKERTTPRPRVEDKPVKAKTAKESPGLAKKSLNMVDGTLESASKRFGAYLPEWVFTRVMFAVAFLALILMLILPGLVATFLLIAGTVIVLFGAVVYSDQMLASRWLPGRTTPTHVLLFGVAILMMGVLLGVIAG